MASRKDSRKTGVESILGDILNPQDMEVFAVRGKGCELVFANVKAKVRINFDGASTTSCKTSLAKSLPDICDHCGNNKDKRGAEDQASFEIEDMEGRIYSGRCNNVEWIDGKPASVFVLRDITEEKASQEQLYKLAYIDQLTGVPNRQKLKDDFGAKEAKIADGSLAGVIALFDLDHFKTVNDTYGHNTGDMVLRRLTEHLQGEKNFSGRLYRLGGDEFVLLYAEEAGKFKSEADLREHYSAVLSSALRAYTLPNIEVKCTLSIGVSVFPAHGENLSELLRKADIALYQAKANGRNQVVYFESQYDTAQKFKDLYINIQPILNSAGKTLGYELVDRGNSGNEEDNTVNLNEFNRTLDALGFSDIENNALYFITYSKQLLNPAVLKNLPRDKFIIQIKLPEEPGKSELADYLRICVELRKNGYKIALTGLHSNNPAPELLSIADYCKFSPADKNTMRQKKTITGNKQTRFIAVNVDTPAAFQAAKDMGYLLFQGYYFNQPVIGKVTKEISPLKSNYYRLLKLSSTDDYMDFREISAVISSDVALSYKLLRILNSAAVGLRNVSSIAIAVAYLGEESLKKWISVLALTGIGEDKPLELVRMSLIRARFGELLAPHFRIKRDIKQVFLVGMLSLLHVALEMTKEQLIEEIAVADDIKDSLINKTGVYSDLLRFFEQYEYANWEAVSQFVEDNQLDPQFVNDAYISAVKWYNDLVE